MPFVVSRPETEAEFLRMAELRSLAFGREQVYIDMIFPKHHTPEGAAKLRDRMLDMARTDHTARFVIASDVATGTIASQAEWHYYEAGEKGSVMELGFVQGTLEEQEYARYIIGTFQARRRQAIIATGKPLMLLDSLTTDPKFQRKGAAMQLVQWGLDEADRIGAEAYLEASEYGKPLYLKLGFVVEDYWTIPLPDKWADETKISVYLMRRPVQQ